MDPELNQQDAGPSNVNDSNDKIKVEETATEDDKVEIKVFQCSLCILKENYEYFGRSPPWVKEYMLEEDTYIIEDPFMAPKQGEFLILGAHCVKCRNSVCKDVNCSFYYDGTFCMKCAKDDYTQFPKSVQEKLNRIIRPL